MARDRQRLGGFVKSGAEITIADRRELHMQYHSHCPGTACCPTPFAYVAWRAETSPERNSAPFRLSDRHLERLCVHNHGRIRFVPQSGGVKTDFARIRCKIG